jgi:hypothetical protein
MKSTFVSAFASTELSNSIRNGARFATIRFNKDGFIRDGRTYSSENGMRAYRNTRPKSATMIEIIERNGMHIKFVEVLP